VAPAGRGLRASRLHRIALVHLLRRFSSSLGGLESRPGLPEPGREISPNCGDKKSGECVFIWEGRAERCTRRCASTCSHAAPKTMK
jgi:hypothetical protein